MHLFSFLLVFILGLVHLYGVVAVIQNYDVEEIKERHRRSVSTDRRSEIRDISPEDRPSCPPGQIYPPNRVNSTQRLRDLRDEMRKIGIDAYIIPSGDAHQSEYTSPYDQRRKFICGLSGSAGYAIVTMANAALWTDGRYFLQAEAEMDCNWILMKRGEKGVPSSTEWLISVLEGIEHATVGSYPYLLGSRSWTNYEKELSKNNITLVKTVTKKIKRQRPFQNEEHESLLLQRELIKIQKEWLDVEKERLGIERERLYIERRRLEMEERTRGVCTAYKQPEERRTLQMDHELFHGAFMQI